MADRLRRLYIDGGGGRSLSTATQQQKMLFWDRRDAAVVLGRSGFEEDHRRLFRLVFTTIGESATDQANTGPVRAPRPPRPRNHWGGAPQIIDGQESIEQGP